MEKTVQFKKEIPFESSVINSISLEKEVTKKDDNIIEGYFILEGEKEAENFNYKLPFKINVDPKYDITNANLEITNFTYSLSGENLIINIEVTINDIVEDRIETNDDSTESSSLADELNESSIFGDLKDDEYQTYRVHILRNNETIDSILEKYEVTKELVEKYNDLSHLKIGDKIIVPSDK